MALQGSWNIPSGNPYGAVTTAAMGMSPETTTKKKIDWQALAPVLARVAGILVAGLVGGKDYGGIAAGSAAGTLNQLAQLEEEQKQRELERQIREWEFNLQKQVAEQEERRRQALRAWGESVLKDLGQLAQSTPSWTLASEAITTPELKLQGAFGEEKEPWKLTAPAPAEATYVPAQEGDKIAKQLMARIGSAENWIYLPEETRTAIEKYLWEKSLPKEPEPKRSKESFMYFSDNNEPAQYVLANYSSMTNEELDKYFDKALAREIELQQPAVPKRSKALFEQFSKENEPAKYALTHYDSMTNRELDEYFDKAVKREQELKEAKQKSEKGAGVGTSGGWDPSKIYRGSPKVQLWLKLYDQYLREQGETAKLEDILSGKEQPKKAKTLEQWLRGQPGGAKVWAQIASEFDLFGDPFYSTEQGMLVVEKGSVEDAIVQAIKSGKPKAWVQVLINRNNENRKKTGKKTLDYDTWKRYVDSLK